MGYRGLIVFILSFLTAGAALAGEVSLAHGGLTLNAQLDETGDGLKAGGVLIVHGTLAHNDMEALRNLRAIFKARGVSTLAINLGYALDDRHGMVDCAAPHRHRHADALDEIGAWLDWLQARGAGPMTLLGHSRGGSQAAWYAAERRHALLKDVVLLGPLAESQRDLAKKYEARYGKPLAPLLARSAALVKSGKGATLMPGVDFLYCKQATVSAASFASYYAPEPRRDTPGLIPAIRVPALLVVAGDDEVVPGLAELAAPRLAGSKVSMKVIEGSDHFFRDLNAEDAVDAIEAFRLTPAAPLQTPP